jgi:hypothetical protein
LVSSGMRLKGHDRRYWRLPLYLVAGALVSLLVAWGSELWLPEQSRLLCRSVAATWHGPTPEGWPERPDGANICRGLWLTMLDAKAQRFQEGASGNREFQEWYRIVCRSGLPFRSMESSYRGWHDWNRPTQTFLESGIRFDPRVMRQDPRQLHSGVLSTKVLWPGFMLNAGLFALALFTARHLPRALRVRARRRRGECTRCGFDLRGLIGGPCPECGRDRAASSR